MNENEQRLIAENQALKAMVEQLLARVAELEARLNQNSGNSSKPPSSDMGRKAKPPVGPSGRKRGGQRHRLFWCYLKSRSWFELPYPKTIHSTV